jgi:hypothetical protein
VASAGAGHVGRRPAGGGQDHPARMLGRELGLLVFVKDAVEEKGTCRWTPPGVGESEHTAPGAGKGHRGCPGAPVRCRAWEASEVP